MDGAVGASEQLSFFTSHQDRTKLHLPVLQRTSGSQVCQRMVKEWSL